MMGDCKMIHTMKIYLALVMLIAAVMMATMFAKADTYLYWTVDVGDASV